MSAPENKSDTLAPAAKPSATSSAVIDPAELRFRFDALKRLCAEDNQGQQFEGIIPQRLFPMSDPEHWIALMDHQFQELCLIPDLQELSAEAREILNQEMARREFVPVVKRIAWVSGNSEPCEWKVETDRGLAEFILQNENDVRRLGEFCVLIVDAHGIRYLIPDERKLDAYSRRVVDWYV